MKTQQKPPEKMDDAMQLASSIVAAYVGNNKVNSDALASLLQEVYTAVTGLSETGGLPRRDPAVPVAKSITPDFIICLEDGKKLKMLKRYLRTHYNLSPEEYRRKWGLPADYPMTAPNYAKARSRLAKDIGLGTTAVTGKNRRGAGAKRKSAKRAR